MSNEFINIGSANSSPEQFQLRYISISKYEGDWQSLPHTHHFCTILQLMTKVYRLPDLISISLLLVLLCLLLFCY